MWEELGISYGTAIIILIALYFIIKWGVKNGIKQYFEEKEQEEKMKQQLEEYHTKKTRKSNNKLQCIWVSIYIYFLSLFKEN